MPERRISRRSSSRILVAELDVPGNNEAIIRYGCSGVNPPDWLSDDHLQQTLLESLPDAYLQHASPASCGSGIGVRLVHSINCILGNVIGRLDTRNDDRTMPQLKYYLYKMFRSATEIADLW